MKKILYTFMALVSLAVSSCSNEDIEIRTVESNVKDAVTVNISLSNFFQSYSYNDTRHDIKVSDDYRTFHSEFDKYIQVRTLFYKKNTGELQDSIIKYVTTTNNVVLKADLPTGNYYAITTLVFADKEDGDYTWWDLANKENLKTAKMTMYSRTSKWNIMSESSEEFSVESGKQASVSTTPKPVGSLCYIYMHNFQYKDEATYRNTGVASDNGIRRLALYTQQLSDEFNLDPNTTSKYNYWEDAGKNSWYFLHRMEPSDFNEDWTFFKTNLYGYSYVIAPNFNIYFGYVLQGESTFQGYGKADYSNQNGKVYLAYWDWFQVGNPFYGIADNNHWNVYTNNAKAITRAVSNGDEKSEQKSFSPDYIVKERH